MKTRLWMMLAAAGVIAAPADTAAQVPGFGLELFPRAGVFKGSDLGTIEGSSRQLASGLAIGLSAGINLPILPDIRASLDYVPGVALEGSTTRSADKENTLLVLTGDLVVNLSPPLSPIKPYGLLGGGVKKYEFDPRVIGQPKHSDLTLHVGAGVGVKLGPLSLVGEASDYISWFKYQDTDDGKVQNDIFIMVGFKIGMF